jgi:hypothetical protein
MRSLSCRFVPQRGATGWATTVLLPGIAGDYKLCGSPKAGADYTDLGFAFVSVKPGEIVGVLCSCLAVVCWLRLVLIL